MYYYAIIENGTGICYNLEQSESAISNPYYIQIDSYDNSYLYRKKYVNGAWVDTTAAEAQQFEGSHIGIWGEWLDNVLNEMKDHTHTEYAPSSHDHTGYAPANHTHTGFAAENHEHSGYAAESHSHSGYASTNHEHTGYASENHEHTGYASSNHSHSGYASSSHTHSNYFEKSGGTITGETNFSGGLVRLKSVQTLFHSGTQLVFGSNNLPTRIGGSAITATKTIVVDSDERLKNVYDLDMDALRNFAKQIKLVAYELKEAPGRKHLGVVAQQLLSIDPEIAKFFVTMGADGYYAVDYTALALLSFIM